MYALDMELREGTAVRIHTPGESCDGKFGVVYSYQVGSRSVRVTMSEDDLIWSFRPHELEVIN